jgi:hypothetical protein
MIIEAFPNKPTAKNQNRTSKNSDNKEVTKTNQIETEPKTTMPRSQSTQQGSRKTTVKKESKFVQFRSS